MLHVPTAHSTSTLHEVARAAGVSPSTVSRILNGTAKVSDDKRKAVEAAIAKLNYKPNLLAQGLKKGRGMTIGILTQDLASPFFANALRGVEAALAGTGYAPLVVSGHWQADEEAERVELLIARRMDGIIILSGCLSDAQIDEFAQRLPIVVTGRPVVAAHACNIALDQEAGARLAVEYLLARGHRRIAFIAGPPDHDDAQARLKGYRAVLEAAGIAYEPAMVAQGNFLESGGLDGVETLLARQQQFSALLCANDQTAYGARLALYRRGIAVPDEVSIIGFDDLHYSSYTTPPLTTVRQPVYEVGRQAAESVLQMLAGLPAEPRQLLLELVERESVKPR
ncbi:LacI family DNA-binding transcriptional regulator [Chitinimonas sp.]|uniref:LacI family DNA-binding transcriptional regulator n=1 Tax=Chitinimonas sp. TaxID=1934313 RepID=UPI002F92C4ED